MTEALKEAQGDGALSGDLDSEDLAVSLIGIVEGGYVLARAIQDPAQMDRAIRGAVALLDRVSEA